MIRASVNLTVASMLISFATSMKLPLSTTYVTFMVAMGSSLADRAWGRESAVYRVAGVLNVIAGWFFTAFVAFTAAASFAGIIYGFGGWGVGALCLVAVLLMGRSFLSHRKQEKEKEEQREFDAQPSVVNSQNVTAETREKAIITLSVVRQSLVGSINGLVEENAATLRIARNEVKDLKKKNDKLRHNLFSYISRVDEQGSEGSRKYLIVYDFEEDIVNSTVAIAKTCKDHVDNVHKPMDKGQAKLLFKMRDKVSDYIQKVETTLETRNYSQLDVLTQEREEIMKLVEDLTQSQVKGIKKKSYGSRNSLLFFSLLLETKNLALVASKFLKFYAKEDQFKEN
jgi:predicted transcriptional regulator